MPHPLSLDARAVNVITDLIMDGARADNYSGSTDNVLGIPRLGLSAPAGLPVKEHGFMPENLAALIAFNKT